MVILMGSFLAIAALFVVGFLIMSAFKNSGIARNTNKSSGENAFFHSGLNNHLLNYDNSSNDHDCGHHHDTDCGYDCGGDSGCDCGGDSSSGGSD